MIAAWCAWLWQPEHQVRLHQKNLLKAYEGRDWQRVGEFIDAKYADRWEHDKGFVLQASKEVFAQFIVLSMESEVTSCTVAGPSGKIAFKLKIKGQGSPVAAMVMERVNPLHEPFVCDWVRQSWKPWEWKLVRVDQPELTLDLPEP